MRIIVLTVSTAALLLSGCGPKKLALPSDPIDRAASCAVVGAIAARTAAPSAKGGLAFAAQAHIIHYAMLAASEGKAFSSDTASAVVKRMSEVEAPISAGKWQELQAPCDEAYPQAAKTDGIELPAAKFDAQLGCYAMADFLGRSVQSSDPESGNRMNDFNDLRRKLDAPIGNGLKARGASSYQKTQVEKDEALARMTKIGSPASVMKLCTERYG